MQICARTVHSPSCLQLPSDVCHVVRIVSLTRDTDMRRTDRVVGVAKVAIRQMSDSKLGMLANIDCNRDQGRDTAESSSQRLGELQAKPCKRPAPCEVGATVTCLSRLLSLGGRLGWQWHPASFPPRRPPFHTTRRPDINLTHNPAASTATLSLDTRIRV